MSVVNAVSQLRVGAEEGLPSLVVDYSAAFAHESSQQLNQTVSMAPPTERKLAGFSTWFRHADISQWGAIVGWSQNPGSAFGYLQWNATGSAAGTFQVVEDQGGISLNYRTDGYVFRDPTAWSQLFLLLDTTQVDPVLRVRLWVSGLEVPMTAVSAVSQNSSLIFNENARFSLGYHSQSNYLSHLQAQTAIIRGELPVLSDYGEVDALGVWQPKDISGLTPLVASSCYLDFALLGDLGNEVWNGNDFTNSNGVVQRFDVPQDTYPIVHLLDTAAANITLNDAGLRPSASQNVNTLCRSTTVLPTSGKWCAVTYYSFANSTLTSMGVTEASGVAYEGAAVANYPAVYLRSTGSIRRRPTGLIEGITGGPVLVGERIACVVDCDASPRTITYYRDGVQVSTNIDLDAELEYGADTRISFAFQTRSGRYPTIVFGEDGSAPIAGSTWLSSRALPALAIADPRDYVETRERVGDGGTQDVTLQMGDEGLSIVKQINANGQSHIVVDSVRGEYQATGKFGTLRTNDSSVEQVLGTGDSRVQAPGRRHIGPAAAVNASGATYSDIYWKHDVAPGLAVITYTGDGITRAIPHGLGRVPEMVWVKRLDGSNGDWYVGNEYTNTVNPWNYDLALNSDRASAMNGLWPSPPDVTNVTVSGGSGSNGSGIDYVMYVFAPVPGFSAFGRFDGNSNVDGPFMALDFQPEWAFTKDITGIGYWRHTTRAMNGGFNPMERHLFFNTSDGETASGGLFDFLAAGLKVRRNLGAPAIWGAFARHPFGPNTPNAV